MLQCVPRRALFMPHKALADGASVKAETSGARIIAAVGALSVLLRTDEAPVEAKMAYIQTIGACRWRCQACRRT